MGAVCVACVLVSALALRVVFYMTGISIIFTGNSALSSSISR